MSTKNSNILKVKEWRKTHKRLLHFIESKHKVTGNELRAWIAECIVYFTEINMQTVIIEYFLSKLDYNRTEVRIKNNVSIPGYPMYPSNDDSYDTRFESNIGPFPFDAKEEGYILNENGPSVKQTDRTQMTPILVAFKVADNILNNIEDDERVIPKFMLNEFNTEKTQDIYISLGHIQKSFEEKNVKGLLASLVTTTDLVCKLIPEVSKVKDLGPKLRKIFDEKAIYDKYKINREVIWALNNSRIIRNLDTHAPKNENHTTIFEAVGYSHILILFIGSLLSSGEIKLS